ncbi:helix-turn-helix transcriptional regulator [Promicromonospora thailandica]|uniref:Proteasome accessory factor B n=1 Tax=Promicromonospora thailandica TaxID=765201 RepID=A0A9X2G4D3_9MICO|nr:WYL domain-containing protein [Promicromonospora thailandica]MCP2265348.1 proteasome accessory factor B [Promicromonospora thailandica]BFF16883.1 YafY family protein [Promicromonospora thailandica]
MSSDLSSAAGPGPAAGPALNPAERLLNLVIALVNTNAAMTKQQVRAAVAGYADAPSAEAFERMFERDKDMLRALGVPVVTVGTGGHTDELGYRIDQDAYALPSIDLTPAELGVLSLAAQFWQDKTLQTDITRAMVKLRAAGAGDPSADALAGLAPSVRAVGDAYGPLMEAIEARRAVTFAYRAAYNGAVLTRHVEPWRIAARDGGWYLMAFDRDRQAPRVFRMSRIESRVRIVGASGAYQIPEFETDVMLGKTHGEVRQAVVAVRPERASALRARAKAVPDGERQAWLDRLPGAGTGSDASGPGWDVLEVPFRSLTGMASEAAGYGAALVVLDPEAVREETVRRLRAAAALAPATAGVSRG